MIQLPIFKDFDGYSPKYHFFKNSLLGQVHDSIPWDELVACLPDERVGRGAPSWFGGKGMFALMFLKAYFNISDRQLLSVSIQLVLTVFLRKYWLKTSRSKT